MSRRSVYTQPDSDASFDSDGAQPATAYRSSSSSSSSSESMTEESVELLEVVENGCASDFQEATNQLVAKCLEKASSSTTPGLDTPSRRGFEEAVFAESSSDSGQATVGSSTSSGKHRLPKVNRDPHTSGESSVERSSQGSVAARRSTRLKSLSDASDQNAQSVPTRRSTRLKSISDDNVSNLSRNSSVAGNMEKVTVSSTSKGRSSQNTSDLNSDASGNVTSDAADNTKKDRILQIRLQRMSIDMSNLKVGSKVRLRKNSTHSETSNGPSPRKSRARTPSTKCLESFNLEDLHLSPRRRTTRKFTPSKKYAEMKELKENRTPKKSASKKTRKEEDSEEEDEHMEISEDVMKKSTILYDQHADVAGQNLFSFRTPKKRDGMAQLAALAPKTPQTPKTPRHLHRHLESVGTPRTPKGAAAAGPAAKTPSRLRSILKKELAKFNQPDTSASDFSGEDSDDYKPDELESEADDISDAESNSSADKPKIAAKKKYCPPAMPKTPQTRRSTRFNTQKQQDFVPESEEYFNHHTNKKSITSDRTLDRMKTPRLPHDHLFQLLANTALSPAHEHAITEMHQDYRQYFSKWLFTMNEGFNIMLHGLGSKRNLLQQFHKDVLAEQTVLVVNGFFPSLTIKDVLDSIAVDILEMSVPSRNHHEVVDGIEESLNASPDTHIFLIVHNIDGAMLRNDRAQLVLSRLAKMNQIHLIASMDHINAPLLWDHTKLSNYNFAWWDVTTMLPYTEETAFENSMLVNNSGGLALSSMKNVFLSLTNNSRGIFLIIVRNQLNNKGNSNFQGMPFKDLYSRCREDFLVSSDVALRSQLTEFIDHNLVKMRRTSDGIEHLQIPLDAALLEQFLELQENND